MRPEERAKACVELDPEREKNDSCMMPNNLEARIAQQIAAAQHEAVEKAILAFRNFLGPSYRLPDVEIIFLNGLTPEKVLNDY